MTSTPWTLTLPNVPCSLNVLLRLHWSKRRKLSITWSLLLIEAGVNDIPDALRKRQVSICRYAPRTLDSDNLVASYKLVIDALVRSGALFDDSPEWLDLKVTQLKAKRKKTCITITDFE